MGFLESMLVDIGRIGMGGVFLFSIFIDIKTRTTVFDLMRLKKVPVPWLFYVGAIGWKAVTSIGIIFNIYLFASALLLSLYIFIANLIFNDFWKQPKERRDFALVLFLLHLAVCFGLLVISGSYV